jgi:hypothetical protein
MSDETPKAANDVVVIQPWQLLPFLDTIRSHGHDSVTWGREVVSVDEALVRARALSPTATVVVDGTTIYAAEPDHSADDPALHRGPVAFVKRRPQ